MWNNSAFHVERRVKGRNFLMLDGRWVIENKRLYIVNVYAPCDLAGKILYEVQMGGKQVQPAKD